MITKQQIEAAAHQYCEDNRGDAFEFAAFTFGVEYGIARCQIIGAEMQAETERLAAENRRLFEQAAALQAENGVLRGQIEELKKQIKQ